MSERSSRQSFLGEQFEQAAAECIVGIVGLGGGGSHIVQQLAHIGFQNFILYDGDVVEESNLTRLVGATNADALAATKKIDVAKRLILGLQPGASVTANDCRWQSSAEALMGCHFIFGCVDTFSGRSELEAFARRYLISYIDIGMDVTIGTDGRPVMGGQVTVSLPGQPCMRCLGILTEKRLSEEALAYGDVGGRPQVVWANGILASTAVGRAVDLLSDWTGRDTAPLCLSFDGNREEVKPHWMGRNRIPVICNHYPADQVGTPIFTNL